MPGNSPNANETLPSDLTSSSDKLIINEETSPAVTPASSPATSSVLRSSLLPRDKESDVLSPKVAGKNTNEIVGDLQVSRNVVKATDKKDKKDLSTVCSQKDKSVDKKDQEVSTSTETKDATTLEGTQSRKSRNPKDAKNSQLPGKQSDISAAETVSKMTLRRDIRQSAKAKEGENSSKDSKSVKNKQISSACSDTSSDETDSESTSQDETCESEKQKNVKSGPFVQSSRSVKSSQTSSKPAVKTARKSSQEETAATAKPESIQSKKSSQDSKCAKDSQVSSKSNVRTRQSSTEEEKTRETENTGGQRKNSTRKETQTKCEDAKKLKLCKDNEAKGASEKRQIESQKETEGDKSTAEKRRTRSQSKSHQEEKDNKNKPSKSSKSGAKDKVNQTKKGVQPEMSKSLRTYREIYSSTDEDSSDEDEIADDKNQKVTGKPASETVKETSKQAAKEKVEAQGKSDCKSKTPRSTTPSTTIIAKSSESKKGSLGSYRIPKKTSATNKRNDKKSAASEGNKKLTTNSDKICGASVKDVPQQSASFTPKASGKLTSPLLTTTKVSPLHMTSTCQLSPGMMNLLPVTSHQQEPMKSVGFTTSSPVATTTRGNKGGHSLSDLLSRCEAVFSNNSVEDKERTHQNNEISDLKRPSEVTQAPGPKYGAHKPRPSTTAALPSVLTGLLAQTAQTSSVPRTTGNQFTACTCISASWRCSPQARSTRGDLLRIHSPSPWQS